MTFTEFPQANADSDRESLHSAGNPGSTLQLELDGVTINPNGRIVFTWAALKQLIQAFEAVRKLSPHLGREALSAEIGPGVAAIRFERPKNSDLFITESSETEFISRLIQVIESVSTTMSDRAAKDGSCWRSLKIDQKAELLLTEN